MKKILTKTLLVLFFIFTIAQLQAQTDSTKAKTTEGGQTTAARAQDSVHLGGVIAPAPAVAAPKPANSLNISVDMRVRAEFRHGYRSIPLKDTAPAAFINQRTRLNFDFKTKGLDLYASLQDARVWGEQDPREGQGGSGNPASPTTTFPVYLFEGYVEPHFNDKWSLRIGRQRIVYDNQRLFAENDWRLSGNSHDAIRFIFNNKINLSTELTFAFNQSNENIFTTNYVPLVKNYKDLVVHYLNYKFSKSFILTTINTMDGFQSAYDSKTTYQQFTSGGRLEYQSYNWYLTTAAYYQYGKDSSGKKMSAYYIQPEIKFTSRATSIRLGMEYLSGQDSSSSKDNNFVPLYGVSHRFMGNLDFFTTFPGDVKSGGIINPYLFFQYQKKKWTVRIENHLFYSHTGTAFKAMPVDNKYLGFENDWRLNFKPTPLIDVEYGFCWAKVTNSMLEVKNSIKSSTDFSSYSKTPYFSYLSIRVTPVIGKFTF